MRYRNKYTIDDILNSRTLYSIKSSKDIWKLIQHLYNNERHMAYLQWYHRELKDHVDTYQSECNNECRIRSGYRLDNWFFSDSYVISSYVGNSSIESSIKRYFTNQLCLLFLDDYWDIKNKIQQKLIKKLM